MKTKVVIKNIFHMLSYGYRDFGDPIYKQIGSEEFDHLEDLFAAILNKWVSLQVKQGLYKQYLDYRQDIPFLRGQIDIYGTVKNRLRRRQMLSCDFSELTEDCTLNRIIKSAMLLLLKSQKVTTKQKVFLRNNLFSLATINTIDIFKFNWTTIHFDKANYKYKWPICICYFLVQNLLPTEENQTDKMELNIDKCLSSLYERFVFNYFISESKKYPNLTVDSGEVKWNVSNIDQASQLNLLPSMNVDARLKLKDRILIIDAKYYSRIFQENFGKKKFHSSNLYQIFTYVNNEDKRKKTSGMLLYARTNDNLVADGAFWINGYFFSVKTLDLNCEFEEIKKQLNSVLFEFVKKQSH